jgi:hypothetical protein
VSPGWYWPGNSRKAHYFGADSRSLCGRFALFPGMQSEKQGDATTPASPDDCAACRRKVGVAQ